jgi:hypothetical protein
MPILTQSVSVSEDWQIDESDTKPPSFVVQLRKSAVVLPWFRFVYAEGDDSPNRDCLCVPQGHGAGPRPGGVAGGDLGLARG